MKLFANRTEAGRLLAAALQGVVGRNAIALAIPRGGVVIGFEVARGLKIPLDIIIPRKIGAPGNPELAIGAVTEEGTAILDERLVEYFQVSKEFIDDETKRQVLEIKRRLKTYRGDAPYPSLKNREVVIVDDGIATGYTMKAALVSVRGKGAKNIVIAVPVAPRSTIEELRRETKSVICLQTPEHFRAIGQFYKDFAQTSDMEVIELLRLSRSQSPKPRRKMNEAAETGKEKEKIVKIPSGKAIIEGSLVVPRDSRGLVLFAHGSGSGRFSPRNRYVAEVLNKAGMGTLLVDLLTKEEERVDTVTRQFRFDIDLLAQRLISAIEWLKIEPASRNLAIGLFGSSTGAAAALIAAARLPDDVRVVVSRGGRPDLAMKYLPEVKAPVLLIVGGWDDVVIDLNKEAMKHLHGKKKLEIVPNASHLFEEPGRLEEVARLAAEWFLRHFGSG